MQTSNIDFDISLFKPVMTQDPTQENGWIFEYEGPVDKEFKDSTMKVYKKKEDGTSGFTMRIDAVLKGVKAENFILMQRDVSYKAKMGRPPKQIKILEQTSKNIDILYTELDLPFPLANRDFVQKRLFIGNKEDPELVRELGLFDWSHEYHAILVQSTENAEYPAKSKPIRGETKMHHILLEEDPNDKSLLKMKMVISQQLNGDIPKMVMNSMGEKMPQKMMTGLLTSYNKFFGKL